MLCRLAALLLITVASASPMATIAANDYGPSLTARLGSTVIDPRDAGRYHCHDLDYPLITCFRSSAGLESAVESRAGESAGPTALAFVRVYVDELYGGASAVLSQSYARLGDIGWNDRITSFRGVNSGDGTFFKDAYLLGAAYDFCCNQQVPNVGGSWNDTFSSLSGSA